MKTKYLSPILVLLLASCATVTPGNDSVVVNAERSISTARSTFDLIEKTEYDVYPAMKAVNPKVAAQVRTFVNKVRANQQNWLQTATNLKNAYQDNRNSDNKAQLESYMATLVATTAEAVKYIALMAQTHAWLSYQLSNHIGERK